MVQAADPSRRRARADLPVRVVAGAGLVASLIAGFGVIDLVTAIAPGPEWEALRMLEAGWGLVFAVVVPAALAVVLRRGGGPVAAVQQLVVVTASLACATLLTLKPREWLLVLVFAAFTAVVIALHPARSRLAAAGRARDRALVGLAAIAAVPAGVYAADMAASRRHGVVGDTTLGFEHWTVQSALAICVVLLVALGSVRTDGWRLPVATAAVTTIVFGAVALMAGDVAGNVATGWAIGAIAWGGLVALAAFARPAPK